MRSVLKFFKFRQFQFHSTIWSLHIVQSRNFISPLKIVTLREFSTDGKNEDLHVYFDREYDECRELLETGETISVIEDVMKKCGELLNYVETEKTRMLKDSDYEGEFTELTFLKRESMCNWLLGDCLVMMNAYDEAISHYNAALEQTESCERSGEEFNVDMKGWLIIKIGNLYCQRGEYNAALPYVKRGMKMLDLVDNPTFHATTYYLMGMIHSTKEENEKALELLEKALKVGKDIIWKGELHFYIASAQMKLERYEESLIHFKKAYELVGDISMKILSLENSAFIKLTINSDQDGALSDYSELLDILKVEPDHRFPYMKTLFNIGMVSSEKGEREDAIKYFQKCFDEINEEDGDEFEDIKRNCADVLKRMLLTDKNVDDNTLMYIDFFIESSKKNFEINKEQIAAAICERGFVLDEKGKYEEALVEYETSLKLYKEIGDYFALLKISFRAGCILYSVNPYDGDLPGWISYFEDMGEYFDKYVSGGSSSVFSETKTSNVDKELVHRSAKMLEFASRIFLKEMKLDEALLTIEKCLDYMDNEILALYSLISAFVLFEEITVGSEFEKMNEVYDFVRKFFAFEGKDLSEELKARLNELIVKIGLDINIKSNEQSHFNDYVAFLEEIEESSIAVNCLNSCCEFLVNIVENPLGRIHSVLFYQKFRESAKLLEESGILKSLENVEELFIAKQIKEMEKDLKSLDSNDINAVSLWYYYLGEFEKCVSILNVVIEQSEDSIETGQTFGVIGGIQAEFDVEAAKKSYEKSIEFLKKEKDSKMDLGITFALLGKLHYSCGEYEESLNKFEESSEIFKEMETVEKYVHSLICIGLCDFNLKNTKDFNGVVKNIVGVLKDTKEKSGMMESLEVELNRGVETLEEMENIEKNLKNSIFPK